MTTRTFRCHRGKPLTALAFLLIISAGCQSSVSDTGLGPGFGGNGGNPFAAMADGAAEQQDATMDIGPADIAADINETGTPGDDCCDDIVCGDGLVCDPGLCSCVLQGQGCDFIGEPCTPGLPQPDPFTCVAYGEGQGICKHACVGPIIGDPDTCDPGTCGALPGEAGYCVPNACDGFFQNTCGPDATCLPMVDGKDACVPDGDGNAGSTCYLHNDCGHNLLCIGDECETPNCSEDGITVTCEEGEFCALMMVGIDPLDVGTCVERCMVFDLDTCGENAWCYPITNAPDGQPVDGYCSETWGSLGVGEECQEDADACDMGLTCVQSEAENAVCEAICEPTAVQGSDIGACPTEQGCVPLLLTDDDGGLEEVLDFGTCVDACEPWVDVSESGCPQDTWCVPTTFNPSTGECSGYIGLATEFMACDEESIASTCMAGLLCMGAQYNTPLSGTCKRLCHMEAADNCSNGMICEELAFMSNEGEAFPLGVGTCTFP